MIGLINLRHYIFTIKDMREFRIYNVLGLIKLLGYFLVNVVRLIQCLVKSLSGISLYYIKPYIIIPWQIPDDLHSC